jgi:hypothetical protein
MRDLFDSTMREFIGALVAAQICVYGATQVIRFLTK